jgi:hypothetical protein
LTAGIVFLGLAMSGTALAQVPAPVQPDPNSAPPDKIGPPLDQRPVPQTGTAEPLSKDLARSQGVVHPPAAIDPGMSQTPPDPGSQSTPVIKPPAAESGAVPK